MASDSVMEKAVFDSCAAEYDLWYQTPKGRYADALEKELFLRLIQPESGQSLLDVGGLDWLRWNYSKTQ